MLAVILGGGAGTRLFPLTSHRAKPAVPLAGKYRLVDVPISNCINSDLRPWTGTQRQPYVAVAGPASGSVFVSNTGRLYAKAEGTSASAALVSGAVALVRARNPNMSGRTVVQRLLATALPINKPVPDEATGYGAIRIARAMDPAKYPVPADAPNPVYDRFDQLQGAAHKATAAPAASTAGGRKPSGGSSPVVYAAVAGVAALLVGGLAFVWRRARRPSAF